MLKAGPHPLIVLQDRLDRLGKVLAILCLIWVGTVCEQVLTDLTPSDIEHHRTPVIRERLQQCEGEFAERFDCTQAILLDGERTSMGTILLRLAAISTLPVIAWGTWIVTMRRCRELAQRVKPYSGGNTRSKDA